MPIRERGPVTSPASTSATLGDAEVRALRADFPILAEHVGGHPLVYLDSGATAQQPLAVLDAVDDFVRHRNAAVHRGAHTLAAEATEEFEDARATVAAFVGARPEEIVWTTNATEAINIVAYGVSNASVGRGGAEARRFAIGPGDEIVATELEHHANLIPWQELAARTGASLRIVHLEDDGTLREDELASVIGERTRIVAVAHVSNVLGTVTPVERIVALAHAVGALVVLDACQSVPHRPVDVAALGVDFAAFSGHKMLGPTGVGVLWGRRELLDALPPVLTGGSMITTVSLESAEYLPAPQRFEAGTQKVAQAIGLAAAVRYLEAIGMERVREHEERLARRLLEGVSALPGMTVLGPPAGVDRGGLVSLVVDGVHAHDVGQYLDEAGIAVRVGHHCAQPLHRRFGVTATVRASTYLYTTEEEVDAFLDRLASVRSFFRVAR